jgi:hypothetical protein
MLGIALVALGVILVGSMNYVNEPHPPLFGADGEGSQDWDKLFPVSHLNEHLNSFFFLAFDKNIKFLDLWMWRIGL